MSEVWVGEHKKYTVISLFAGCGGSSHGYKMAGFEELLAVEWDKNASETFKMNFSNVPIYTGDIAKLTSAQCMALAGIGPGELDILDGSPPCQGFSMIGKRSINDPRNSLFLEYARLLRDLQPKIFVMENVPGLVQGHMKRVYLQMVGTLRECGYRVRGEIMNAKYFGVPQSRRRVIIIGVRSDLNIEPNHPRPATRPIGPQKDSNSSASILTNQESYKLRRHRARNEINGSGYGYHVVTERSPTDTIVKTNTSLNGFYWRVGDNLKKLSEIELKRIGSFPDDFKFTDLKKAWERVGNSVPPNLMREIAQHLKNEILMRVNK